MNSTIVNRSYKDKTWSEDPFVWLHQPAIFQIDTSNYCNLALQNNHGCIYCNPQGVYKAEKGYMPFEKIEEIFKKIEDAGWAEKIFEFHPYVNGDPLMDYERMPQILELAKKTFPNARTSILSNGACFGKRDMYIDKNLDEVRFTFSAGTRETYKTIHNLDLFNEALKTIQWVKENRTDDIHVHFIKCQYNFEELDVWQGLFEGFTQHVTPVHITKEQERSLDIIDGIDNNVYDESFTQSSPVIIEWDLPCVLWENLSIGVNGEIMQCCICNVKHNYGNVFDTDLQEAWNRRIEDACGNEICQSCNIKHKSYNKIFNYVFAS